MVFRLREIYNSKIARQTSTLVWRRCLAQILPKTTQLLLLGKTSSSVQRICHSRCSRWRIKWAIRHSSCRKSPTLEHSSQQPICSSFSPIKDKSRPKCDKLRWDHRTLAHPAEGVVHLACRTKINASPLFPLLLPLVFPLPSTHWMSPIKSTVVAKSKQTCKTWRGSKTQTTSGSHRPSEEAAATRHTDGKTELSVARSYFLVPPPASDYTERVRVRYKLRSESGRAVRALKHSTSETNEN